MSDQTKTYAEIAWVSPHIGIGSGYSIMKRELKDTALEKFDASSDSTIGRTHKPKSSTIATQSDLETAIKNSVSASAPIDGVKIEVSASYLHQVKVSDREMSTLIEEIIEDPPRKPTSTPRLSPEALDFLSQPNGPQNFTTRYGDYFVYGSKDRSVFTAICHVSAKSKEALDEFKASVSLGAADIVKASRDFEVARKEKKSKVNTSIELQVTGYGADDADSRLLANTDEIVSSYQKFQQNFRPVPYLALLQHYSTLDNRIPPPGQQFMRDVPELTAAYQRVFMLQSRVTSSPMVGAANLATTIGNSYNRLQSISIDKPNWVNELKEWSDRMKDHQDDYDKWELRRDLLMDMGKLSEPKIAQNTWFPAAVRHDWSRGIMTDRGHFKYGPIALETQQTKPVQWNPSGKPFYVNNQTFHLGQHGRTIVAFRINSNWNDNTNGEWRLTSGYTGDTNMEVGFKSEAWRGADWSVDLWTVDSRLYEKAF